MVREDMPCAGLEPLLGAVSFNHGADQFEVTQTNVKHREPGVLNRIDVVAGSSPWRLKGSSTVCYQVGYMELPTKGLRVEHVNLVLE
jgi:hypothetical protein